MSDVQFDEENSLASYTRSAVRRPDDTEGDFVMKTVMKTGFVKTSSQAQYVLIALAVLFFLMTLVIIFRNKEGGFSSKVVPKETVDAFMKKHNRGFTLIELLVVISIIGLLSSVVLASLNTARSKARDAKTFEDIHQLTLALQLVRSNDPNFLFPGITGNWQCLKSSGTCWSGSYSANASVITALAPYMSNVPTPSSPAGTLMYDAYLYLPNYASGIGSSPPGTYIIYALENPSSSKCNGYFAGAYDVGYYYCYSFIDGL